MPGRVIFTFATGHPKYALMAKGLALSLKIHDCEIRRVVVCDRENSGLEKYYDQVVKPVEGFSHWFTKLSGLKATDADALLFVDADGFALRPLAPIFDAMEGCSFGVQGLWREEVQWYGDMTSTMRRLGLPKIPLFSGGLLYYERNDRTLELISRILSIAETYDELGLQRNGGHIVDEVCTSVAMAQTGIGTVFPDSQAFSFTPWGLMGRLHLDVLAGECRFLKGADNPKLRSPLIYHSGHAKWDPIYWRELNRLLKLEADSRKAPPTGVLTRGKIFKRLRAAISERAALRAGR